MGLTVSFVESLEDIVPSVVSYLSDSPVDDIFRAEHIIVPNAGVRSWLLQQIAGSVGVGAAGFDGIAANVNIGYLGQLDEFIGRGSIEDDPWNVGPLAVSILAVASRQGSPFAERMAKMGGGLKAARAIADRFDRYQARRPSMIREWEKGNAVLAPEVGGEVAAEFDGEHLVSTPPLAEADRWQFDLWREVRDFIGVQPWPVRIAELAARLSDGDGAPHVPPRLLVAGLQSLSVRHIELLKALSGVVEVTVVMVHPSPVLATRWSAGAAHVPVSPGIAPKRSSDSLPDEDVDELAAMWLRGARETQEVLASQGIEVQLRAVPGRQRHDSLLQRVQASVSSGTAVDGAHATDDMSIRLHRAHNLGRQVEILHDALLHAFRDTADLEPHDVVILCADIEEAAPLLEAVFDRQYGPAHAPVRLPLVVADRSLRDVDEGASLLAAVLAAVRGRFSIDNVMAVATSGPVLRAHGASADDATTWSRIIDKAAVRWGASADHRARLGVDVPGLNAHTWSLAIDRALLGAVLPDAEPGTDTAGVVPMVDVDASDLPAVTVLSRIVTVLSALESRVSGPDRPIHEWSDAIADTLEQLADVERGDLDDALAAVDMLRSYAARAAGENAAGTPVSFAHAADLLGEIVSGAPGRQPLRTGAITATSLVPLRGVPFKVVCLVGFDEGSVPSGDADGDDLLDRQKFAGDIDARLEFRRAILDAVCCASERLIITCNGKSIRNNADLPLITPLAEFVDLCVRCGATLSSIEHHHPRHFSSPRNFRRDGVVGGIVWSHDETALAAVRNPGVTHAVWSPSGEATFPTDGAVVISPSDLHRFVTDPLHAFVATSLGINTWVDRSDEVTATIPLDVGENTIVELCEDLHSALTAGFSEQHWDDVQTTAGNLPPGVYGKAARSLVKARVRSMVDRATEWGIDVSGPIHVPVRLAAGNVDLAGVVTAYPAADGRLATISFRKPSDRYPATNRMALDLLMLRAAGYDVDGIVVTRHDDNDDQCIARHVELTDDFTQATAVRRVEELVALYSMAMESPCPLFGKTALALGEDNVEALFAATLGERGYLATKECLVYGPLPSFEQVFPVGGVERDFFRDFATARPARATAAEKGAGTIKPPVSGKAIKRYIFQ